MRMRIIYGSMMMITILVMETESRFTIIIDHLNFNLIVNNNLDKVCIERFSCYLLNADSTSYNDNLQNNDSDVSFPYNKYILLFELLIYKFKTLV